MKVSVDQARCQGHNRCAALAPQTFDIDDYGTAFVIAGQEEVSETDKDDVGTATRNCPERAVTLSGE